MEEGSTVMADDESRPADRNRIAAGKDEAQHFTTYQCISQVVE
jgi:hypothetical protein